MIDYKLSNPQIVVLAAGFSARLGRPKALAKVHGISLIKRTISVLARVTRQRIMVITAPRATRLRLELRGERVLFVTNSARHEGLSASVALALRKCRASSGTLFLPVDLVELDPLDIARLLSRWRKAQRQVIARGRAGRAAVPLILPKYLYSRAQRLIGDVGLRNLVAELPDRRRVLIDLTSAERDIDTPQDLREARCRAARRVSPRFTPEDRLPKK